MNISKLLELENSSEDENDTEPISPRKNLLVYSPRKPLPPTPSPAVSTPKPILKENRFSLPSKASNFVLGLSPTNTLPRSSSGDLFLKKVRHKGRSTLVRDFQSKEDNEPEDNHIYVDEQIKKLLQEKERNSLSIIHRSDLLVCNNSFFASFFPSLFL